MRSADSLLLATALALSVCAIARASEPADGASVEVRSEELRVDHRAGRAEFSGAVEASYGQLRLECERMVVTYGEGGEVRSLVAEGGVVVRRAGARATAARARLDAIKGLLVLEGDPHVVQGPHAVRGERVEVVLATGEMRVTRARGRFQLDLGRPR